MGIVPVDHAWEACVALPEHLLSLLSTLAAAAGWGSPSRRGRRARQRALCPWPAVEEPSWGEIARVTLSV